MLLLLALACRPCGELEIRDPRARLSDEQHGELAAAHAEWIAWTGGGPRVCVDRIVARELDSSVNLRGRKLQVDPDVSDPTWAVRWAMCEILDEEEGHTAARPDIFGEDARFPFAQVCSWGPWDPRWKEPIRTACGTDELSERDRYVADEVYTDAPSGRLDGALAATVGETIGPIDGSKVAVGEQLLVLTTEYSEDPDQDSRALSLLDPLTGEEQPLWSELGEAHTALFGGREGAALVVDDWAGTGKLVSVSPEGTVSEAPLSESPWIGRGTVGQGALWTSTSDSRSAPLARFDLETGAISEITLPTAPEGQETLVWGIQALDDGLWLELAFAFVEVDYDFTVIATTAYEFWRYQPDDDSWSQLTEGVHLLDAGVDTQGRVAGSVFSEAGRLLAVYDVHADALLLSDDVCIDGAYPTVVTGDRVWRSVPLGDDWGLEALVL